MNPSILTKIIPVIENRTYSLKEFSEISGIGPGLAAEIAEFLVRNEIGSFRSERLSFHLEDKIRASLLAVEMGADLEQVSEMLDWKDFEALSVSILGSFGYVTHHTFRLKRPRIEIDVVGTKDLTAVLVDCKHWRRSSPSLLDRFATMQVKRAETFLNARADVELAVPVILTLHSESITSAGGVPIVPVAKFASFLNEMAGYSHEFKLIRKN